MKAYMDQREHWIGMRHAAIRCKHGNLDEREEAAKEAMGSGDKRVQIVFGGFAALLEAAYDGI